MGEAPLWELLSDKKDYQALPEALHEKLLRHLKYYLYIGGMPEPVASYAKNQDISEARSIQNEILKAYERDFSKYSSSSEAIRVSEIWRSIPQQLAKENKKFMYSAVKKGGRASYFESAVEWLHKAGLLQLAYQVETPKLPLSGYADNSKFKTYLLDSGLLGAMLNLSSRLIVSGDSLFSEYNGAFIENYVSAELTRLEYIDRLYYWASNSKAEVDFIVARPDGIFPLEVKSGTSRHARSLRIYAEKYRPGRVYRASARNFTRDDDFINLPLYAVALFGQL
jgi:hypothetical protein